MLVTNFIHRHPFVVFLIPLVFGILLSEHLYLSPLFSYILFVIFATISLVLLLFKRDAILSFAALLLITGFIRSSPPDFSPKPEEIYHVTGTCIDVVHQGEYILKSNGFRVYFRDSDTTTSLDIGDHIEIYAKFTLLRNGDPLYEFDYDHYLRQKGIHYRMTPVSKIISISHHHSFYGYCQQIRDYFLAKVDRLTKDSTTRELLKALCLGDRTDLSSYTNNLFRNTGTVHLLSVSGLHMGAIFLLLSKILSLLRIRKRSADILLIPSIWIFAGITGFSPSACRAAAILSFVAAGRLLNRNYLPLNAIGASAFFTLLLFPHLLYSISFQMSYAAYSGIILFMPRLQLKRRKLPKIVKYIYTSALLSLCAQLTTVPLTAYYFHQININSIFINIIAIPIATLLLYVGFLAIVLPTFIGFLLFFTSNIITRVLIFILEQFNRIAMNYNNVYPGVLHLLLFYSLIILTFFYAAHRKRGTLYSIYGCMLLMLAYSSIRYHQNQNREELIVYNSYRLSQILLNHKGYYILLGEHQEDTTLPHIIKAYDLKAVANSEEYLACGLRCSKNMISTDNLTIQTTIGTRDTTTAPADILIVTGNAYPKAYKANLSPPKTIIIDASNYKNCVDQWEEWSNECGINLLKTADLGNIRISIKKNRKDN